MTKVVVTSVLSRGRKGVVFSGLKSCGSYVRVIVEHEAVFPFEGEVYEVDEAGATLYRDAWGNLHTQLEVDKIDRVRTSGVLLRPWLERLPNVGPKRSERLINRYPGDEILEALQGGATLDELAAVIEPNRPVLGDAIAAQIIAAFSARNAKEETAIQEAQFLLRLEGYGVENRRDARLIWRLLAGKDDVEGRLIKYPYMAAAIIPWTSADRMGQLLLAQRTPPVLGEDALTHQERLLGAVESAWIDLHGDGHTAAVPKRLRQVLSNKGVDVGCAIDAAIKAGVILVDGGLYRSPGAVYLENRVAKRLGSMLRQAVPSRIPLVLNDLVHLSEKRTRTDLFAEQRDAVKRLLRMPLGVLQGPAGSGKTHIARVLCDAWEATGGNVVLAALPGKAALELSHGASTTELGRSAFTIARMLGLVLENKRRQESGKPLLPHAPVLDLNTLLIIDESSMVDTPSFCNLLDVLPEGAHLLLMGDHGQLPSVGIGRIFHDLVEDRRCLVTLKEIRRQDSGSPIPVAADSIRNGKMPDIPVYRGIEAGIFFCETEDSSAISTANQIYREARYRKGVGVRDVMFVAARKATVNLQNRTCVGDRLNMTPEVKLSKLATVAVGDPVVCTHNRYKDGLFNGTLGVVTAITDGTVLVHWDGEEKARELSPDACGDVDLAFALTCHRAQGSAAQVVVVPLEVTRLLTQEWLYTAITRARLTVVLVGSKTALCAALNRRTIRITGFRLP